MCCIDARGIERETTLLLIPGEIAHSAQLDALRLGNPIWIIYGLIAINAAVDLSRILPLLGPRVLHFHEQRAAWTQTLIRIRVLIRLRPRHCRIARRII